MRRFVSTGVLFGPLWEVTHDPAVRACFRRIHASLRQAHGLSPSRLPWRLRFNLESDLSLLNDLLLRMRRGYGFRVKFSNPGRRWRLVRTSV